MTDQAFIEAARKNCYCGGCGLPKIPQMDGWKPRCSSCFTLNKALRYCKKCANPLEKDRIDYAKRKGGECSQCFGCSKGWTQPHPVHEVILPSRFYLSV